MIQKKPTGTKRGEHRGHDSLGKRERSASTVNEILPTERQMRIPSKYPNIHEGSYEAYVMQLPLR